MSTPVPILLLHERPAQSNNLVANLTNHAPNWRRTIRACGGFYLGDFTITNETMAPESIWDLFVSSIGRRIVERTAGIVTWEGEIVQMNCAIDSQSWQITLDPERFQNKVKVNYTDAATGAQLATAWSEDTDSSDIYGESCYIDTVGDHYDSTIAVARRDRRLIEFAFPQTLPVGEMVSAFTPNPQKAEVVTLSVRCAGYYNSMNRRYQEADIASTAISSQISTLVGNSEFVTAGRIETNSDTIAVECAAIPQRLWDLVSELIKVGDASGNRWVGGVYAGREFIYEQAATTVTHYWKDGQLLDKGKCPMVPSMIMPNIVVQASVGIPGALPPGGNVWDNVRNTWVEEVEFEWPDKYRIIPYGGITL